MAKRYMHFNQQLTVQPLYLLGGQPSRYCLKINKDSSRYCFNSHAHRQGSPNIRLAIQMTKSSYIHIQEKTENNFHFKKQKNSKPFEVIK